MSLDHRCQVQSPITTVWFPGSAWGRNVLQAPLAPPLHDREAEPAEPPAQCVLRQSLGTSVSLDPTEFRKKMQSLGTIMKQVLFLSFIVALIGTCDSGNAAAADPSHPNIIVFLVDDMGVMDTSVPFLTDATGKPKRYPLNDYYRTPNMERLAAIGIRFNNFYAMSVCSPTRISIMTGQNAARHHATNWINPRSDNRGPHGPPELELERTEGRQRDIAETAATRGLPNDPCRQRTLRTGRHRRCRTAEPGLRCQRRRRFLWCTRQLLRHRRTTAWAPREPTMPFRTWRSITARRPF